MGLDIFELWLHERTFISKADVSVLRVPSGFLYEYWNEVSEGYWAVRHTVFVPYDDFPKMTGKVHNICIV